MLSGYLKNFQFCLVTPEIATVLVRRFNRYLLNCSLAIFAPLMRLAIFWKAMSRATSGLPCFGFTSMLKGENPQSSVAPN